MSLRIRADNEPATSHGFAGSFGACGAGRVCTAGPSSGDLAGALGESFDCGPEAVRRACERDHRSQPAVAQALSDPLGDLGGLLGWLDYFPGDVRSVRL